MGKLVNFNRNHQRIGFQPYFQHDDRCNDAGKKERQDASSVSYDSKLGFVTTKDLNMANSYRVTLYGSGRFEVNEILAILRKNLGRHDALFYHVAKERANIVFYVVGDRMARLMRRQSRYAKNPNGQLMTILTEKAPMPVAPLDQNLVEAIKEAMARLYDRQTQAMDLSNFSDAIEFRRKGVYVHLNRANIFKLVVSIIVHNTPNLVALNLSNNGLATLEAMEVLSVSCPNLQEIDLSRNELAKVVELRRLKGMNLTELHLHHNPLDKNNPPALCISYLRNIFKSLKRLNGTDVNKATVSWPIVSTRGGRTLPGELGSCFPDDNVRSFVFQFFEDYFNIYDSNDRSSLIEAYHDNASFTYALVNNTQKQLPPVMQRLEQYSHNLLKISELDSETLLKYGGQPIVSQLQQLPKTQHAPSSMKIDVPYTTPYLMVVVITGQLQEYHDDGDGGTNQVACDFDRTFLMIPFGAGCVIINDMFHVTSR